MVKLACLLGVCALACGSVRANPDAGPGEDGGGGGGPDGGGGGGPDASTTPGVVNVTVWDEGQLAQGATVVFMGADGSLLAQETTDVNGEASAEVPAGSSVHVFAENVDNDFEAWSILDVAPGDDLEVGQKTSNSGSLVVGTVNVNIPAGGLPGGATQVIVEIGCQTTSAPIGTGSFSIDVYDGCIRQGNTIAVVATARNDNYDGVAFSANPNVTLAGSPLAATVTLPAWSTAWTTRDIIVNNAPADLAGFDIEGTIYAHGSNFDVFGPTNTAPPPPGGSGSYDLWFAPGVAELESQTIAVFRGSGAATGVSFYARGVKGSLPASTTVDLSAVMLPLVHSATFANDQVSWVAAAPSPDADAMAVQMYWSQGAKGPYNRWTILAPPDTTSPFELPVFPAGFSAWYPGPGTMVEQPQVIVLDVVEHDGYDEFRRELGLQLFGNDGIPGDITLRASIAGGF